MKDSRHLGPLAMALAAVALLSDCGGGGAYGGGSSGGGMTTYTVGGRVDGLDASTSVLLKNASNSDTVTVSANGGFAFPMPLTYLAAYDVQVQTNPTGRTCVVLNGSGTVPFGNVTNVTVACTSNSNAPAPGDLVITEVLADPAGAPDTFKEWFEVLNTNAGARDIGGVVVTSGTGLFVVPAGKSIPGGAFFVFAGSSDSTVNGGLPPVDVNYGSSLTLANTNFNLNLSVAGSSVDSVGFTTMPDGASLALSESHTDPTANDAVANWCTSTTAYGTAGNKGTPGATNADCL
jgi:hypothetical protein